MSVREVDFHGHLRVGSIVVLRDHTGKFASTRNNHYVKTINDTELTIGDDNNTTIFKTTRDIALVPDFYEKGYTPVKRPMYIIKEHQNGKHF